MNRIIKLFPAALLLFAAGALPAQEHEALDAETIKQANNPLAPKKSLNIHNYIMPSFYGTDSLYMNNLMFRYAQPVGPVFLRATMPVTTMSMDNGAPTTGLGDFSLFAIYKFKMPEGISLGAGPVLVIPTATNHLGQEKWQTGLSAMAFISKSHVVQFGALVQWQFSVADGSDDTVKPDVNVLNPQIFFMWQLGNGTYLRSTGIWSFDLEGTGNYNVPVGLGIGKVIKAGNTIFNIFMEPQYSVMSQGIGQSKFQVFIGFNTQFIKKM